MASNYLKLNDSKTDFIVFGSQPMLKKVLIQSVVVGDEKVPVASKVKNIGAVLDNHLKMDVNVNNISKNAWFSLYQLGKIKSFMTDAQLKSVVQALVISKLD